VTLKDSRAAEGDIVKVTNGDAWFIVLGRLSGVSPDGTSERTGSNETPKPQEVEP